MDASSLGTSGGCCAGDGIGVNLSLFKTLCCSWYIKKRKNLQESNGSPSRGEQNNAPPDRQNQQQEKTPWLLLLKAGAPGRLALCQLLDSLCTSVQNTCAPPAHVKLAAVRTTMATIPLKGQPALGDDSERASPPVVEGGQQGMAAFQVAQNFQDFFIAVLVLGSTLTASPHCCVDVPVPQVLGPICRTGGTPHGVYCRSYLLLVFFLSVKHAGFEFANTKKLLGAMMTLPRFV